MNQTVIFWPMIAHVVLVAAMYVLLKIRRLQAVRSGAATPAQFKDREVEPDVSLTVHNNILNQFESPVLFHVVCLSLFVTNGVSYVSVTLAWLYILSRYAHAWVHITSNRLRYRTWLFRAGLVLAGLMWVWLALHLLGWV